MLGETTGGCCLSGREMTGAWPESWRGRERRLENPEADASLVWDQPRWNWGLPTTTRWCDGRMGAGILGAIVLRRWSQSWGSRTEGKGGTSPGPQALGLRALIQSLTKVLESLPGLVPHGERNEDPKWHPSVGKGLQALDRPSKAHVLGWKFSDSATRRRRRDRGQGWMSWGPGEGDRMTRGASGHGQTEERKSTV